ncbi:hypothetical protein NDN08_005494 [Rhodosorus marinus]|uniref:DZANK-type domain-containing protein n=1 Tax=Rhodosorus marinus TaxID=101924 RepID=A0AAV8V1R0_9RHOD|nr:hypothetical protein NDN08_005494 [Rhodosorus marinus]
MPPYGNNTMQNMYEMTGRRGRQAVAPEDMGVHGGLGMAGDQHQMRMSHQMGINQGGVNAHGTAKRGRTPGTKVLRTCPECSHQIPAALSKCLHCSKTFREKKQKGARSGKRGKKICPACRLENPAATSTCKGCGHVFRLKITEKFNKIVMNKAQAAQQKGMASAGGMNAGMMAGGPYGMAGMGGNGAAGAHQMVGMNGVPAQHGYGYPHQMNSMTGIGGMSSLGGGIGGGLGMMNGGVVQGMGMGGRGPQDHRMDGNMHRGGR